MASFYRNQVFLSGKVTMSYIKMLQTALQFLKHRPAVCTSIHAVLSSYMAKEDAPHDLVMRKLWEAEVRPALEELAMEDCYFGLNPQRTALGWWVAEQ